MASFIKALNCKVSKIPLPFPPPPPPFLAKWSDNCFKCDAKRLFSPNLVPFPFCWGGDRALAWPDVDEGVGGGGCGGEDADEEELKEALNGRLFGGEAERRSCCWGGNWPPRAWVYAGTLPSRNTTARMTWRTWSSGQFPRRILWGRPRPFGLNSAIKKRKN